MYDIDTLSRLDLGRQGENATNIIEINVKPWLDEFEGASFVIMHVRPGETSPYAAASGTTDTLTWTVVSADVALAGKGVCEIRCILDNKVKKSRTVLTQIYEAIVANATAQPPSPVQGWADRLAAREADVLSAINSCQLSAQTIINMANELIDVERLQAVEETDGYVELKGTYNVQAAATMPVGSIWMTEASVDPGIIFGGSWEKIEDMTLFGSGENHTVGNTGGTESYMLTMSQLPEEVQ